MYIKNILFVIGIFVFIGCFSQEKVHKKHYTRLNTITINTNSLDNIVLENANSNFIETILAATDTEGRNISVLEENSIVKIDFYRDTFFHTETVFRKFITKRLHKASAIIKIPKNKKVFFTGGNINIESLNYVGDITIFIEKGILKLNDIQKNCSVQLYAGTVYANVNNKNIKVVSNTGIIKLDSVATKYQLEKKVINRRFKFSVNSIKAAIFLTTKLQK